MTAKLTLIAAICIAPVCRADDAAPLDPARVVSQFRKAYHKRAFVESLDITVRTASEKKRESVVVRGSVKGELRLDLGDLTVWTDGPRLLAVHRRNAGTYFEAALDPADRAASLLGLLPPLPVPQVALVLQPVTAGAGDWTVSPLCREPRWEKATAAHQRGKPAVVLEGSGANVTVRVAGVGDPPVIVFADTASTHDGVTTTISAEVTRLEEPVGRLACDLRGRERVEHLTDLRAQVPDMRPGLAMPELIAEPLVRPSGERERSSAMLPEASACVLLIFSTAGAEAGAGASEALETFAAGTAEQARASGIAFRALAARSITDSKAGGTIERVMQKVTGSDAKSLSGAAACYVSYSPPTTLARFAPEPDAPGVAVVIDASGLVHAIIASTDPDARAALKRSLDSLPK